VLLFAWAVAIRQVMLAAASWATGWAPLDLAMLGDGHSDMVLSKSFPALYVGTQKLVPFVTSWRDDPHAFFTRFPVYPAAIALASKLCGDLRLSALAVSQLAGALAVVRFRLLADSFTPRAGLAAALFAVFPATWLETTSMAYTEGLLVLCGICAFHCWTKGRLWRAAAWAGVAAVVQKHGFLVLLALGLAQLAAGRRRIRDLVPLALGLLPPALLGLYFWALSGDPFTVIERNQRLFGDGASPWNWPLVSFVNGLVTEGREFRSYFWLRKLLLLASFGFYVAALERGLGGLRDERRRPLAVWLATNFAFCICMGGVWAYYYFARYMLLGAAPAILLTVDRVPWPGRPAPRAALVAAVAIASIAVGIVGAQSMWELSMHIWTPRYYEQLRPLLVR
jgi:hypothetical protein